MPKFHDRIDEYIQKSAPFAKPVLHHLRELVHDTCPEIEEGWKWSFPHFMYRGEILCSMASFKSHCAFGFWKGSLLKTGEGIFSERGQGMGHLGKIRSLADLPPDELIRAAVQEAMLLNETKQKVARAPKSPVADPLEVPADFQKLLIDHPPAMDTFMAFSPSNKKEYLMWIADAKTDATRTKRMATSIEWLLEGKVRLWKYQKS